MEAARLREWYSAAQALVAELSSKSGDASLQLDVHNKHFHLYRLVHKIKKGAGKVKQGDSRAIWLERASTLQTEVHELTRSIIQNANQDLVPSLLAAGASTTEGLESEKATLQESVQAAKYQCEALEATISEHAAAREQEAATVLELRTRTVVLQQDVRQHEADARELAQRLQVAMKEREALAGEKERMAEDLHARAQLAETQGQVIAQLMADSEESKRELAGLRKRAGDAEQDAHVLRVNLGNHGQVIEKLILLNAEMMEAGNKYAAWKEEHDAGREGKDGVEMSQEAAGQRGETTRSSAEVAGEPVKDKMGDRTGGSGEGVGSEDTQAAGSDEELPISGASEAVGNGGRHVGSDQRQGKDRGKPGPQPKSSADASKPDTVPNKGVAPARPNDRNQGVGSTAEEQTPQSSASNGQPSEGHRKTVKWTSDMLPSSQRPTSPRPQGKEASQGHPDAAGWVGSKIQGVGGRARGLLNYVAGLDTTPTDAGKLPE